MKHLLKNLQAKTKLFRHRADVPNLTDEPESSPSGRLKIMPIILFVLAAHVVVIGGWTAYNLVTGGSKDAAAPDADKAVMADAAPADKPAAPDANATAPADKAAVAETATPADAAGSEAIHLDADPAQPAAPAVAPTPVASAPAPVIDNAPKTAAVPAPASASAAGRAPYVVKGGDNLHKIAIAHGTTVAALQQMNGLKGNAIRVGQKLTVPVKGVSAPAVAVATAPAPVPAPVAAPAVAQAAPAAPGAGASYTVVKGDTLTRIAKRYNTSPAALMAANKMTDPRKLKIGGVLRIPAPERREVSSQQQQPLPAVPTRHAQNNPDLVMNK